MEVENLKRALGNIDVYVLDQILKERYNQDDKILDAGCGGGRNIHWLYHNNFRVWGVDRDSDSIDYMKNIYSRIENNFEIANLTLLPFSEDSFDHIICSAVLHFAENEVQFRSMLSELIRVLKPNGSILIRVASNIGLGGDLIDLGEGIYTLGDGTNRFLLTEKLLQDIMNENELTFLEPLKTTNVNDLRCMSTLVLQKNA